MLRSIKVIKVWHFCHLKIITTKFKVIYLFIFKYSLKVIESFRVHLNFIWLIHGKIDKLKYRNVGD